MAYVEKLCDVASYEFITFWNPRLKRRQFFLRDVVTKRFVRGIKEVVICGTCTFESVNQPHWTKTLYIEAEYCQRVDLTEYRHVESDEVFVDALYGSVEENVLDYCQECCSNFGVECDEIAGFEMCLEKTEKKCRYGRLRDGQLVKVRELKVK